MDNAANRVASDNASTLESLTEFLYLVPVGIVRCDGDGRIQQMNPMAVQLLLPLCKEPQLDIFGWLDRFDPNGRAAIEAYDGECGLVRPNTRVAVRPPSEDGLPEVLSLTITKVSATHFMLIVSDDSELARKDRLLQQKHRDLEATLRELGETQTQLLHAQKMEAVGQLAAGVAHEINTPLQYIGDNLSFLNKASTNFLALVDALENCDKATLADTLTETLRKRKIPFLRKRVPRAAEQAIEGIDTVSAIVSAMKEFAQPGIADKQPTDLNRLIEVTSTVSRHEWKDVAELVLELDEHIPEVLTQVGEINQVLLSLVVNAAHAIGEAAQERGTITMSSRTHEDHVEVAVRDDGCGIPEEIRARVFDPFFTTKPVGSGSGQGLAIARSIVVDKHGGTLDFESQIDVGTTFRMRLPRAAT